MSQNGSMTLVAKRTLAKAQRELAAFEKALGGREALVEELSSADLDPRQQKLIDLIIDPVNESVGLAKLCSLAGLRPSELLHMFREATWARAYTEAHRKIAERVPDVAEGIAERATNHTERCGCTYGAEGPIEADADCPQCKGKGIRFFRADAGAQETVLEVMGLLKRGGGVQVAMQQNIAVKADGVFDSFVKATPAEVINVTNEKVVPRDSPEPAPVEGEVSGT